MESSREKAPWREVPWPWDAECRSRHWLVRDVTQSELLSSQLLPGSLLSCVLTVKLVVCPALFGSGQTDGNEWRQQTVRKQSSQPTLRTLTWSKLRNMGNANSTEWHARILTSPYTTNKSVLSLFWNIAFNFNTFTPTAQHCAEFKLKWNQS